jgi:putative addiction module killer protein
MEVLHYEDEDGRSPFQDWFDDLDPIAAAKVATHLTRLEHGNKSNVKGVGKGVSELVIDFGPAYRVYFGQDGTEIIILLIGGTKKRQQRDINAAQAMWKQYKARKRGKA